MDKDGSHARIPACLWLSGVFRCRKVSMEDILQRPVSTRSLLPQLQDPSRPSPPTTLNWTLVVLVFLVVLRAQ